MEPLPPELIALRPLAPYEDRLLSALAFFRTQRSRNNQAHHCLSMYLRQSEGRIMAEVGFYARAIGQDPGALLELIYTNPDQAESLIADWSGSQISQVFEPELATQSESEIGPPGIGQSGIEPEIAP
ncbi:MAG: hypothetical protein ACAF42_03225 [Limnothrix sp. BL-A-16]